MTTIAFADPRASLAPARKDLLRAFERVLDSGRYILGDEVLAFEREWAERCGTAHAVGVSSGTDALALGLRAVGVRPGHEVLVPAMTAVATWMAVTQIGAVPVGVDIHPGASGMDPEAAAAAVGPRTAAIVAVHLFGQPADVRALGRVAAAAGVPLVEDAAQAHGAGAGGRPVGSFGAVAAFSFYPTKNLGAMGDAGAVTTNDAGVADRVRLLREYGWRTRDDSEVLGVNARLDELQAALLRVMAQRLEAAVRRRREIAAAYLDGLGGIEGLELPSPLPGTEPSWHLFVVRHPRRAAVAAALAERGIGTAVHYPTPPHLTSALRSARRPPGAFPVAERHAASALSLPMYPSLDEPAVIRVVDAVADAARRHGV